MKRSMKIILPIGIVIVGFLAMMFFMNMKTDPPRRDAQQQSKVVDTKIVKLQTLPTRITAFGRVTSAQPINLYSEVQGKLESGDVTFRPAQSFKKGDLLVKIDDRQARLQLNSAKSDLLTALAMVLPEIKVDFPDEYQEWQDYFDHCEFENSLQPLPETGNPKIKLFLSRFNVFKLYFSARDLEIRLEKHYFHAPFDGSIVSADLRVGSTARNGSLLGAIISLESLEIELPVPAADIYWIDDNAPVTLTSAEVEDSWSGKIVRIGSNIDDRTQTVQVYVAVDGGEESALINGVFLEADIPGKTIDNAFAIPPKAIYEDRYVYVIVDGKLETRDIVVLRREANRVLIDGGVENGDVLVVEIMQGVAPGMPARSKDAIPETRGQ
ncbi:MAG: efflux RND transporter periplasmic adaptor subunit [FCB group bacterium]|nr:efflux RND transporter periplasmic adaptor subunit [FCB group bacterium]